MAKVQFGSGVAMISGRVAGTVFAHNRGGSYMRRFSVPVNKRTVRQQQSRSRIAAASSRWSEIGTGAQSAWEAWAKTHPFYDRLGAALTLSGHQAFVQVNVNAAISSDPDSYTAPPGAAAYSVPVLGESDEIATSPTPMIPLKAGTTFDHGEIIWIWATPPMSPGRTFCFDLLKLVAVITLPYQVLVGHDLPDIGPEYLAVFGSLENAVNKVITFSGYSYSAGQLSTPNNIRVICEE